MHLKRLIVNADDYNTDCERNRGILRAAQDGIVTSVSVLSSVPWKEEAAAGLRNVLASRAGIHLDLTRGRPLLPGLKTLADAGGFFYPRAAAWRKALLGRFDLREVEEEFAAQIEQLLAAGITPDHIDGNNHIHVFPGIAQVTGALAQRYGILKVRLPLEIFSSVKQVVQPGALKKYFIGLLSRRAIPLFNAFGLRFPDRFAGIQFPSVADAVSLKAFLEKLPEGTTELMCHPGYQNQAENPFSTSAREQELSVLIRDDILREVQRQNIHLISYSEF